jgi:heptosyltransferase-2
VLGKAYAEELLRHSGLADEVIVFDLPWTAKRSKYDFRRYDRKAFADLVTRLRDGEFDLTIDARMDLRSNILTYLTKAPMRVGYAFGGGSFLLTHAVEAEPDSHHKADDWLRLMQPINELGREQSSSGALASRMEPLLRVTEAERKDAMSALLRLGIQPDAPIVGIHAGASDPRRMWPIESYLSVARNLEAKYGTTTLLFLEPDAKPPSGFNGYSVRTSLRELMAFLTCCKVFLCNDSGPMHIADALDVAVVAVFLTGNPVWHRPYRVDQEVVGEGTGHDFRVAPTEDEVLRAAERQLHRRGVARGESRHEAGSRA